MTSPTFLELNRQRPGPVIQPVARHPNMDPLNPFIYHDAIHLSNTKPSVLAVQSPLSIIVHHRLSLSSTRKCMMNILQPVSNQHQHTGPPTLSPKDFRTCHRTTTPPSLRLRLGMKDQLRPTITQRTRPSSMSSPITNDMTTTIHPK